MFLDSFLTDVGSDLESSNNNLSCIHPLIVLGRSDQVKRCQQQDFQPFRHRAIYSRCFNFGKVTSF